jgi:AbiV family abortive infection protein
VGGGVNNCSNDLLETKMDKKGNHNRLDQYKGRLSIGQVCEGINLAIMNATRLLSDAELLFQNKRYASATSLAILSIEESGKISILRGLSLARNENDLLEAWKDFRSHKKKNVQWILPDLVRAGARKLDELKKIFDEHSDHPDILDNLKQIGFYTDCLGNAHWSAPSIVIDEKIADSIVKTARLLLIKKMVTEKEMELWIKHLRPVWKTNLNAMKQALLNWYEEMKENGLLNEGLESAFRFIYGDDIVKH